MADGPQRASLPIPPTKRCHPVCGNEGSSHLSPALNSRIFIAMQFSTLTTRQPMVEFTYSCSHAFDYGRRNKNSALSRIELTTSSLVNMRGSPLHHSGVEVHQKSAHDVFVRHETRVGCVYKRRKGNVERGGVLAPTFGEGPAPQGINLLRYFLYHTYLLYCIPIVGVGEERRTERWPLGET